MSSTGLQDKVVLIIGAGRDPAPALIQTLAKAGAILAINDLSPVLLDPLVESASAAGGRVKAYVADATRGMPLRAMLDEVLEDWDRIDVLITNPRIQPEAPILAMDEWDWHRTIEMNLNGPFLVTQLVARLMQEQGEGLVFHLVDTDPARLDAPGHAAYAASQQGLFVLSQAAGRELMAYNIRVYTVCVAEMELSPLSADRTPGAGGSTAELIAYLCSPAAAHLAGQVFRVGQTPEGQQE